MPKVRRIVAMKRRYVILMIIVAYLVLSLIVNWEELVDHWNKTVAPAWKELLDAWNRLLESF